MRIVILGFVLLFAGMARISAAAYFVDFVGGSDANAGIHQSLPWKHCPGDPAATGMSAAVALLPGDTIYFKGGVEYAFSGPTGIRLEQDGATGAPITYDGNSDGSWGAGRAVLTDRRGANGITAFSSAAERRHLVIKSFEFFALGGAATLPSDTGVPVAGRFGGGIAFTGGAADVLVDDCVFRELGFWNSQKPMAATSLTGIGFLGSGGLQITLRRCAFSRVARGCDLSGANGYSQVTLDACIFGDGMVWPLDLPVDFGNEAILSLMVTATNIPGPNALYGASWTGYGRAPYTAEINAAFGELVVFSASALASPAASFQWYKNGVMIPSGFGSRLTLGAVDAAAAGTYTAVATNAVGSSVSNSIELVVTGASPAPIVPPPPSVSLPPDGSPSAPVILQQPVNLTVATGGTAVFSVVVTGNPAPTYEWRKNGLPIFGAVGPVLILTDVTINDIANYRVVVANAVGSVLSASATLIVGLSAPIYEAPTITQQPVSATVVEGGTATFSVTATGTPAPSYQWEKNGVAMSGATSPVLTLLSVSTNDSGNYRVVVSNPAGSVTSEPAALTLGSRYVAPPVEPQASILFTTVEIRYAYNWASAVFEVPAGEPRRYLVRVLGPTLAAVGGSGAIADPKFDLYQGGTPTISNDNWGGGADIVFASSQMGAVPLVSANSRDAAAVVTLSPGYAVILVADVNGATGNALVEVYLLP